MTDAAPPRSRWARLGEVLKHPILSGLIVTIVGSVIVAVLIGQDGDGSEGRTSPTRAGVLAVDVEPDDDLLSNTGFELAVPGSLPPDPPPPDAGCPGARDRWLRDHDPADVGVTRLKVVLEGTARSTVTVTGARAEIVEHIEPRDETVLACDPGGQVDVTGLGFDLDANPPRARTTDGYSLGDSFFIDQSLTVAPGEVVPISVSAFAETCRCRWHLVLELSVEGKSSDLVIDDDGRPFATIGSAIDPVARYHWGIACGGGTGPSPCTLRDDP
ncbi:MAG: hypothetical protein ACRDZ1_19440 [Acidimicrobiia bacterium]